MSNYFMIGNLFFYLHSYLKHFNPTLVIKDIFAVVWVIYVGNIFATWLFPLTISIIGIKNTVRLTALLNALNCFFFHWFHWFPLVFLNLLLLGFSYKLMQMSTVTYFKTKYPSEATTCYSLSILGMCFGSFIWILIMTYYINPNNEKPDQTAPDDPSHEIFFAFSIAHRFASIMNIQAVFILSTVFIFSFILEEPQEYGSNFTQFLKWIMNKDNTFMSDYNQISNSFYSSLSHSMLEQSGVFLNKSVSVSNESSVDMELISKDDVIIKQRPLDERVSEQLWSSTFWLFFVISIFRRCFSGYIIDFNKAIGILIIQDDHFLSYLNVLGNIMSMLGSGIAPLLEKRIGLLGWYISNQLIYLVFELIGFTLLRSVPQLFSLTIVVCFVMNMMNNQFGLYTIFSQYELDVALQLNKIFEIHLTLSVGLLSFINTLFFDPCCVETIFKVYFVLDLFALGLIVFFLKSRIKKPGSDI